MVSTNVDVIWGGVVDVLVTIGLHSIINKSWQVKKCLYAIWGGYKDYGKHKKVRLGGLSCIGKYGSGGCAFFWVGNELKTAIVFFHYPGRDG